MAPVKPKPDTGFRAAKIPKGNGGDITFAKPGAPPAVGSKESKFLTWAGKNHFDKKTAADIWYWATKYGGAAGGTEPFAYYWSSVLLAESSGKHVGPDGKIKSSGQAVGIGQIALSWKDKKIPWRKDGKRFTLDNNPETGLYNYGVNLRFSSELLSAAVQQFGYDGAYINGYNPNDPNKGVAWADIQNTMKTAPPTVQFAPSAGPGAQTPNPGDNSVTPFKNPYVTGVNKNGKFATTQDPNKALQFDGMPLTRSAFLALQDQLTSYYVSYTGSRPSKSQIQTFITKGWNVYTLTSLLSQGKNFDKSPIWKEYVGNWKNDPTIKDALGDGKIPPDIARQGIINHWNASTILTKVRQLGTYTNSNEFKGNVATMLNVHSSIMGTPDAKAMIAIKDAAIQGWKPDQYAAWLRSQPNYTGSPEYQTKALTMLQGLGLVTGANAVLQKGVSPGPGGVQPATQGNLKGDKRVPGGAPAIAPTPVSDLGATLSRA